MYYIIIISSEEILGLVTKKNKDWFDENRRQAPSALHAASSSASVEKSRTNGGLTLQRVLSFAQTLVSREGSTKPYIKAVFSLMYQV